MEAQRINFHLKLFNPLFWHIREALRDSKIRFVYVEGGSSAAKTFSICQALLIDQYQHDYASVVFRRQHVDIKDSIYSSFKMACNSLEMREYYHFQQDLLKSPDEAVNVRFRGLDDEENIKGIESFNVVYLNEWNQFTEPQWGQLRKRLRGRENQKFICDWNPISSKLWQYENWIDQDEWLDLLLEVPGCPSKYSALNKDFAFKRINKKGDSIWIKVTYRDNFWIVGHPSGKGGYVDQHILDDFEKDRIYKPNLYRIYANGDRGVIRTGGECWEQFNEDKHVRPVQVDKSTTIHVSLDQNAMPYVSQSIWQLVDKNLRQVNELPCKAPHNNAVKSAQRLIAYLRGINYQDTVFIYGDPSGNNANTIDENNLSWYEKFIKTIEESGFKVTRRIALSHPEVSLSIDFVNDIYEQEMYGYSITIGDNCPVSIDDYISAKRDKDGKMLKTKIKDKQTGISYEPFGHFSDTKRYFICEILRDEFYKYKVGSRSKPLFAGARNGRY